MKTDLKPATGFEQAIFYKGEAHDLRQTVTGEKVCVRRKDGAIFKPGQILAEFRKNINENHAMRGVLC